jgi:GNAT superfamily N-acetyltransferase
VIRGATVADADAIAAISVRAWRRAYADLLDPQLLADLDAGERAARWRDWLERDGVQAWVAEVEGRVVGFASVWERTLRALYVDPVAQGAGVGTALLGEAEAAGACELEVFAENGHGRRFYDARGWRDGGEAGEWLGQALRRYVR